MVWHFINSMDFSLILDLSDLSDIFMRRNNAFFQTFNETFLAIYDEGKQTELLRQRIHAMREEIECLHNLLTNQLMLPTTSTPSRCTNI